VTLILLIFSLTSGPTAGWGSAKVIALFTTSIFLACCFFLWELFVPADKAAVWVSRFYNHNQLSCSIFCRPPQTWFYPNFAILFVVALVPFFWWSAMFLIFTKLWQDVYHWTVISSAVHMLVLCGRLMILTQNLLRLPIGLSAFATSWTSILSKILSAKLLIIAGQLLLMVSTLLLVFADSPDKYWPLVFPAFVVGSAGAILAYTHAKSVTSSISGFSVLNG
jgi:hypothetical protein